MPREELEACMVPAAEEPLSAGDAIVLLGEEVHGAPGTAAKKHRVVFFISGVLPGCVSGKPAAAPRRPGDSTQTAVMCATEPE